MCAVRTIVRLGGRDDAVAAADLHSSAISEGFLPGLGSRFLTLLYRRIARSPSCFLLVAEEKGRVVGFAAGTDDLRRLYASFLLHDGLVAVVVAAPRLLRQRRRVLETLRYPSSGGDLPPAELLALAVDSSHRGAGIGRRLTAAAVDEFSRREVRAAKVVVGSQNQAALALYHSAGFHRAQTLEVHSGATSHVMTWP